MQEVTYLLIIPGVTKSDIMKNTETLEAIQSHKGAQVKFYFFQAEKDNALTISFSHKDRSFDICYFMRDLVGPLGVPIDFEVEVPPYFEVMLLNEDHETKKVSFKPTMVDI